MEELELREVQVLLDDSDPNLVPRRKRDAQKAHDEAEGVQLHVRHRSSTYTTKKNE
eukprot:CAMPEP_0175875860 /NCGR_PEP_ID=MMETSP0107_2-20121207/39695_1 /TAXON_ID=195067 ORGANISM="Goniomonas pacifica, Strain CCMP1869" /NCGR_SAMPLE_ID=MMETSP0107_2 /ASSEMBLY_ACC=CAM_ASM_000203 /LENGTH=55 /DNA_ID=CAMNT_0017194937 /DNA_START=389 /DNA_END=556 /DNA_ORIENTATION=+